MYSNAPALSLAASLHQEHKSRLRIQPRPFCAMLALSCWLLFTASNSLAQAQNTINTVAGQAPYNSVAPQTAIPNPTGIAEDASGNIYVASQYSYYVYKVNPSTNAMSVVAGTGIFGFTGDGGPATNATLSSAVAVAVDKSGNVYLVDGNRIRVVNTQTAPITVLGVSIPAGAIESVADTNGRNCTNQNGPPPFCGDGGPAATALFFSPQAIYLDGSGNLFIADTTDEVIRFINTQSTAVTVAAVTVQPGNVATIAGNYQTCSPPNAPCGDGSSATGPGTKLDLPQGVVTDSAGNIYIGDTRDQRIRCVANVTGGCPNTQYPKTTIGEIVTYAGSGTFCPSPTNFCGDGGPKLQARFHNPAGVWLDSTGNLYVADQWDNRIREVTTGANGLVEPVCGSGVAGLENGTCPKGVEFWGPLAVILDSGGNVTIADSGNDVIRQGQLKTGLVTTIAGSGLVGDGGAATAASLANPDDVSWDATGTNYYIVDNGNNRIREVTANGNISTVVGNGHPSQSCSPPLGACIGDGLSATQATLNDPNGVALDVNGNIYIADSGNSVVRVVNMQQVPIVVATVTVQPGTIMTIAGQSGVGGCEHSANPCGDGGPALQAQMDYPFSVAVDGSGNVYTADYFDSRVRCVVNVAGGCPNSNYLNTIPGEIVTYAGNGVSNGYGNGGPADKANLHFPYGIAADSVGDLQIADSLNSQVRCVAGVAGGCNNSKTQQAYIYDYAFNGEPKFCGDGGRATQACEAIPQGIALDPAFDVFAGGGGDMLVRRIDAPTWTVMTVAGNVKAPGDPGFAGDGGPSTEATLDNIGLSVNAAQQLLIADQGNNRIRQVDMVPVALLWERKLDFPETQVGDTSAPMTAKMQNAGLASLPISSVVFGGADPQDFAIVKNGSGMPACVPQLSPGPSAAPGQMFCYVTVTFTPTQTGQRTATVTINTSLGAQVVNLIGVGD